MNEEPEGKATSTEILLTTANKPTEAEGNGKKKRRREVSLCEMEGESEDLDLHNRKVNKKIVTIQVGCPTQGGNQQPEQPEQLERSDKYN
ncbi:hypothetical protein SOVF_169910 [Spinacia oleracea]|nr:hypothetical protein SOVF_169910 [Spinacia oleracea]